MNSEDPLDEKLREKVRLVLQAPSAETRLLNKLIHSKAKEDSLESREQAVVRKIMGIAEKEGQQEFGLCLVEYMQCLKEQESILCTTKFRSLIEHPRKTE